jgi:hypothetical protein
MVRHAGKSYRAKVDSAVILAAGMHARWVAKTAQILVKSLHGGGDNDRQWVEIAENSLGHLTFRV